MKNYFLRWLKEIIKTQLREFRLCWWRWSYQKYQNIQTVLPDRLVCSTFQYLFPISLANNYIFNLCWQKMNIDILILNVPNPLCLLSYFHFFLWTVSSWVIVSPCYKKNVWYFRKHGRINWLCLSALPISDLNLLSVEAVLSGFSTFPLVLIRPDALEVQGQQARWVLIVFTICLRINMLIHPSVHQDYLIL